MNPQIECRYEGRLAHVTLVFPVPTRPPGQLDRAGKPLPALFLQSLKVRWQGKPVYEASFGPYLAPRPRLGFVLEGAAPGQILDVQWALNGAEPQSAALVLPP